MRALIVKELVTPSTAKGVMDLKKAKRLAHKFGVRLRRARDKHSGCWVLYGPRSDRVVLYNPTLKQVRLRNLTHDWYKGDHYAALMLALTGYEGKIPALLKTIRRIKESSD